MTDFHFNYQDLIRNGWDGNLDSLEEFKEQRKSMLELGWNPKEMTMQQFAVSFAYKLCGALIGPDDINEDKKEIEDKEDPEPEEDFEEDNDEEDDYEERRRRAEEMGWDEEEMDLEEFEDLFM